MRRASGLSSGAYLAIAAKARLFIESHRTALLERRLMVSCEAHAAEVKRRLSMLGIDSRLLHWRRGGEYHVWVVAEDGTIIDAYPRDGGMPRVMRPSEARRVYGSEYEGRDFFEMPWAGRETEKWYAVVAELEGGKRNEASAESAVTEYANNTGIDMAIPFTPEFIKGLRPFEGIADGAEGLGLGRLRLLPVRLTDTAQSFDIMVDGDLVGHGFARYMPEEREVSFRYNIQSRVGGRGYGVASAALIMASCVSGRLLGDVPIDAFKLHIEPEERLEAKGISQVLQLLQKAGFDEDGVFRMKGGDLPEKPDEQSVEAAAKAPAQSEEGPPRVEIRKTNIPVVQDVLSVQEPSYLARDMVSRGIITQGVNVLSLGSGRGNDELLFAESGASITATDNNSEVLEKLSDRSRGIENMKVLALDVEKPLSLPERLFDVVYVRLLLHYLGDVSQKGLLDEIYRVLKPGGTVIIQLKSKNDPLYKDQSKQSVGDGMFFFPKKGYSRNHLSADELKERMGLARLEISDMKEGPERLFNDDYDSMLLTAICRKPISGPAVSGPQLTATETTDNAGDPAAAVRGTVLWQQNLREERARIEEAIAPVSNHQLRLDGLHQLFRTGIDKKTIAEGAKIMLSESLFMDGSDDMELVQARSALAPLLASGVVAIMKPDEMRRAAINKGVTKEKLAAVFTREDFENKAVWSGSDKETSVRASVIILEDKLIGSNYLYLEGVIGLANAVMVRNHIRIQAYYRLISGSIIDENILSLMKDDAQNNIAFAVKAILRFKPIDMIVDSEEFERARLAMENTLIAA
jgi:SAM-dependent methyltransferase